ncbi:class F sortase [Ornithinimicrobium cavernae]|uniref:class F sortase n=1 Tax=Ornithinimicrobium cavernae TaxID=2666047 RepID=UPI0012B17F8F|nr:class F sortase [Ornithinimicrobium cavernae]
MTTDRRPNRRPRSRWGPVAVVAMCALLFAGGGFLVLTGLRETPPEATPAPDQEFSLSAGEALALDRLAADLPLVIPDDADLGPFVNTAPVTVPAEVRADTVQAVSGRAGGAGPVAGAGHPVNHLYIPSIYVSAPIVPQGVTSTDEMELPSDLRQVGLLDTTSPLEAPGGSSLIAGHVTQQGHHGALYFLGRLRAGATVVTVDGAGAQTAWAVTSVRNYRKTSLPAAVFDDSGPRVLTLVTCGGPIIRTEDGRWTHTDNIVVTATPVP